MANRFRKTIDLSSLDSEIIYSLKNKKNLSEYIRQLVINDHSNDSREKASNSKISKNEIKEIMQEILSEKENTNTNTNTSANTKTKEEKQEINQQKIETADDENMNVNSIYVQEF